MRMIPALLASATFALALLAPPPSEAGRGGSGGGGGGGGARSGGHGGGGGSYGGRGAYYGHGGHYGRGHGHGHYGHGYYGGYYPWFGFYAAAPFVFGASYYYSSWDPYWGYYGPRYGYAYDQRPYTVYDAAPQPGQDLGPASQADPNAAGAPQQGPLYMNYCPAAKAYYPKVTACPEGWEFRSAPNYRQ
jgi:hypothetical protein